MCDKQLEPVRHSSTATAATHVKKTQNYMSNFYVIFTCIGSVAIKGRQTATILILFSHIFSCDVISHIQGDTTHSRIQRIITTKKLPRILEKFSSRIKSVIES